MGDEREDKSQSTVKWLRQGNTNKLTQRTDREGKEEEESNEETHVRAIPQRVPWLMLVRRRHRLKQSSPETVIARNSHRQKQSTPETVNQITTFLLTCPLVEYNYTYFKCLSIQPIKITCKQINKRTSLTNSLLVWGVRKWRWAECVWIDQCLINACVSRV